MKDNFIIGGSIALRKAFCEELGLNIWNNESLSEWPSLCFKDINIVQGCGEAYPRPNKFSLPKDWDKAIEFFKKEQIPVFKVGDIVKITRLNDIWSSALKGCCPNGKVKKEFTGEITAISEDCVNVEMFGFSISNITMEIYTGKYELDFQKIKIGNSDAFINTKKKYILFAEGIVTYDDVKEVVEYFSNRPEILDYKMQFMDDYSKLQINFGCKQFTVQDVIDIYERLT